MASRYRSISRPALSFIKSSSSTKKPSNLFSSSPIPSLQFSRVSRGIGSLESMLPLHSAVSSARLTSRLGINSCGGSRSLSQGKSESLNIQVICTEGVTFQECQEQLGNFSILDMSSHIQDVKQIAMFSVRTL